MNFLIMASTQTISSSCSPTKVDSGHFGELIELMAPWAPHVIVF